VKGITFNDLKAEFKKISWPKKDELTDAFVKTVTFSGVFAVFFVLCDFISALCFRI